MGRPARNARGSRNRRPTTGAAPKSLNQGSLNPRVSPQEQNLTADNSGAKPITRSQMSSQQKAFEDAMKKAALERMAGVTSGLKSGSAADRYNEQLKAANKSRTSQTQGRVPVKKVKQPVVRPTVDPMRPTTTGPSGNRPIKQVKQPAVKPIVDPIRQPMSRPQYSEGGSVTRPRTGHTDYRKNGFTISTVDNRKKK